MNRLAANTTFADRYLLIESIGFQAYAESWKAYDKLASHTEVALKVFFPLAESRKLFLETISQGYAITLPLNHPHLIKVTYYDVYDQFPYLVLPLCKEGSLSPYIFTNSFDEAQLVNIIKQMSDVLSYLHAKNIYHLHIKPENILIRENGFYMLSELGLRFQYHNTYPLKGNSLPSTDYSLYDAPEKRQGLQSEKTDIYALGAIIHQLALSKSNNLSPTYSKSKPTHQLDVPLPHSLSKNFIGIISSCLSIDPEQRPSAKELFLWAKNWQPDSEKTRELSVKKDSSEEEKKRRKLSLQGEKNELVPTQKIARFEYQEYEINNSPNSYHNPTQSPKQKTKAYRWNRSYSLLLASLIILLIGIGGWKYHQYHQFQSLLQKGAICTAQKWYHGALYYYLRANKMSKGDEQLAQRIQAARDTISSAAYLHTDSLYSAIDDQSFAQTDGQLIGTWQMTNLQDADISLLSPTPDKKNEKRYEISKAYIKKLKNQLFYRISFKKGSGLAKFEGALTLSEQIIYDGSFRCISACKKIVLKVEEDKFLILDILYLSEKVLRLKMIHGELQLLLTLRKVS